MREQVELESIFSKFIPNAYNTRREFTALVLSVSVIERGHKLIFHEEK